MTRGKSTNGASKDPVAVAEPRRPPPGAKPFTPGRSGNASTQFSSTNQPKNYGGRQGRKQVALLLRELDKPVLVEARDAQGQPTGQYVETTRGEQVIEQLVDMAISGSEFAQALIFERADGKVTSDARNQPPPVADEGGVPSVSEAMERYLAAVGDSAAVEDPVQK